MSDAKDNALLIAAAPDLLAACEKMLVAIHSVKHFLEYAHPDTATEFTDGWNAIEAAIAKAEGK